MKRNKFLILLLLFSTVLLSQDDLKARKILDNATLIYKKSPCRVDFTLTLADTKTEKKEIVKGVVVMKDKKFKLTTPKVHSYFDGKTQYVHMLKNKEVSISTPSFEELQNTNPALILTSYTKQSTVQFSLDSKASLSYHIIDVFPDYKAKKAYYKAIVKIDKKTNNLISIKVLSQTGVHTTFVVNSFKKDLKYNDNFFVFDFKSNPNVITNDLR
ncbi:MAG: outer membrane lipoprotein carrier protein LolA [Paludibacteraceae bacterium]|nr:outer membrane lipoprotein carrier protein LolA [Paludibacteraceae bacterium]MBN2786907.1 outer membrane lipoprotein carrier protein LolA [Paludibacteraceae bacterium]